MADRDVGRQAERANPAKPRTTAETTRQPSSPGSLADHQAAIGNRALQQRLAGAPAIQAKLEVSGPEDAHEREADRVAEAVTSMPDPTAQRQAETDDLDDPDEETVATRLDRQAETDDLDDPDDLDESVAPKAPQAPTMTPGTQSAIERSRGGGRPLDGDARGFFEPRFGRDLSAVRVHTDPGAARLASNLGASAFTVGRNIYFAEGRYQPSTDGGRSLLAHELTHTVQQRPGAALAHDASSPSPATSRAARGVQRDADDGDPTRTGDDREADRDEEEGQATVAPPEPTAPEAGRIEVEDDRPTITYPVLKLPKFKTEEDHRKQLYWEALGGGRLRHAREYSRGSPGQRRVWVSSLPLKDMKTLIESTLEDHHDPDDSARVYVLKHKESDYRMIGTVSTLAQEARDPVWNRKGHPDPKDVDHIVELQVSGWENGKEGAAGWDSVNKTKNMELLDNRANQQSGGTIDRDLDRLAAETADHYWQPPSEEAEEAEEAEAVDDAVAEAQAADPAFWTQSTKPKAKDVKARYDFVFESVAGDLPEHGDPKDNYWTWEEVKEGKPLEDFDHDSMEADGPWLAYPFDTGGIPQELEPTTGEGSEPKPKVKNDWFKPFTVESYSLNEDADGAADGDKIGSVSLEAKEKSSGGYYKLFDGGKNADIDLLRFGGIPNSGYLKHSNLLSAWRGLMAQMNGLSPVEIESFNVVPGEGLQARGAVLPDVPIMADLAIDLVVDGDNVYLSRLFDIGDFELPGPIEITHSTVEVTAGSNGLGASGELGLAIEGVGDGLITARIGTDSGFALAGTFSFDPELFDPPSQIELGYEDGEFSGSGTLSIGENRVRGIKSASIETSYAGGRLDAQGDAELDVPGLERGTMSLSYSEVEGFALGGSFDISSDVPGLSGGSVSAEVRHDPEEGYEVSASGTAVPDIPGVSARVDVAYEDGIFLAEGTAGYERGMLSGSLTVGATNETLDDDDNPTGEAGDTLRAFGGGSLTLALAPWLEATAGVRLTADGEVEVTGRVGLPAALEVFPERRYDRNLLSIDVDIPIVGVTVPIIRRNIGIFASIGGGLDLTAGFGPGELRDLGLEVTYNPEREEDTEVTGGAEFVVPADAGLRLFVRGALGAGIPVVDARVGLEVGGGLGIEGEVRAGVEVAWTPSDGIELGAEAEISAEPKLKLDITGFASVEADVGFKSFDLYSERWDLAGFEYGSGLRLGATFPIEYVEGEPFDMSMDDIEFQVPDVDPQSLLSGVVDEFA